LTDVRRRQILDSAAAVIAERGIGDTRVADIAERIGVSAGLILYYFESKDALLGEALAAKDREFFENVTAEMDAATSPAERIATLIEASCPSLGADDATDDEYVLWIEVWSRARHDARLAEVRREMDLHWRTAIADLVAEGQKAGEFDTSVDADAFALRLAGLIDGLAIQVILRDPDVTPAVMRDLCIEAAEKELGTVLVSPG